MNNKHFYRIAFLALLLIPATSCNRLDMAGMFVSSGTHTEDRVAEWLSWNEQHLMPQITGVPDEYCIFVTSDIHITDSAPRVQQFLDAEYFDPKAVFSIINGDIANESGAAPYRVLDSIMRLPAPDQSILAPRRDTCFVILGNHDIYFDCQQHFQHYFHTSTYTCTVTTYSGYRDLFIFLDSGNATHGARQLAWLRDVLQNRNQYRHVVINTHTSLFRNSYDYSTTPAANFPEQENYEFLKLLNDYNVTLCLTGHWHHREEHIIGNVMCVMTDNLNEDEETPNYLVVTLSDRLTYQFRNL